MIRQCNDCGKEYEALLSTSKYCSGTCRSRASTERTRAERTERTGFGNIPHAQKVEREEVPELKRTTLPPPPGADPASQFIIATQDKEIKRFEDLYNKERDARKELKKANEDLRDKVRQMETDKKIADATVPEKGQLQGIMESPVLQGLLPFIGPAIQEMSVAMVQRVKDRVNNPAAPAGVAGVDGQSPIGQFMAWLSGQPDDVQQYVWEVLQAFMRVNGHMELLQRLIQTRDMVLGQYMKAV